MPRGWYLAQGLVPLGPSDSDDEFGACELPNGRLVCKPHGLIVCGRCCTDYSFMEDVLSDGGEQDNEDDEDSDAFWEWDDGQDNDPDMNRIPRAVRFTSVQLARGTGNYFPPKFVPPSTTITPQELFSGRRADFAGVRATLKKDDSIFLICTDGACLNNGRTDPKAGWGFMFGYRPSGHPDTCCGRLENEGPFGDKFPQTSNRAELRAVIAALRFRHWPGSEFSPDGSFNRVCVIATDSEYVVEGATTWTQKWMQNGWTTQAGPVKNRDLWEALLGAVEGYHNNGMKVKFWRIPREWNTVADAAAKDGAAGQDEPKWGDYCSPHLAG